MFTVGIYQKYDYPDLRRQTPGCSGMWEDVRFVINRPSEPCDVLVVLNGFYEKTDVECREIWQVVQEPPIDVFSWLFKDQRCFDKVFSPKCPSSGKKCTTSHGALPWHIDMSYDDLRRLGPPDKGKTLSAVISNKALFPGHRRRIAFLNGLRDSGVALDLYGQGHNPIRNKYEGMAAYRYSLAIENYSGAHYWTEKVADCFLSWTMPIYYGCTNLADYFPSEAFVQIDIEDPHVFERIEEVTRSDQYARSRDAIEEARKLILDRYQLFPFLANEVKETVFDAGRPKKRTCWPYRESMFSRMGRKIRSIFR